MQSFTVSSLDKVFSNQDPRFLQKSYTICSNERFSFQFCYKGEKHLIDCNFEIDSALNKDIECRVVEELPSSFNYKDGSSDEFVIFKTNESRTYPELLSPIDKKGLSVRPCMWQSIWLTIYNPQGIESGTYPIRLMLKNSQGEILTEAIYTLEVLKSMLPKSTLINTCWVHYDCICEQHSVRFASKKFYAILRNYITNAVQHNMNMLYIPIFTPALDTQAGTERLTTQLIKISYENGKYNFNFDELKIFLQIAIDCGIEYFEMAHLATQWGARSCPKIMVKENNRLRAKFGWHTSSSSVEYVDFLEQLLPALDCFFVDNGWVERVYFHISDEPSEKDVDSVLVLSKLLLKHIPNYPVIDALSHYDLSKKGAVKNPVVAISEVNDFVENNALSWVYYCSAQRTKRMSNRFFNMESLRTRIIGLQLYYYDIEGFLHWGYNFYRSYLSREKINPYYVTDAGGVYESGDAFVVYPSENGCIDSLRHEVLAEAFQDICALKLLESKFSKDYVKELLTQEGLDGFDKYPDSADWFVGFRQRINALLI